MKGLETLVASRKVKGINLPKRKEGMLIPF